jgi:hypothetical protein
MNHQKLNILTGWIIFLIALVVYILTLEPTVSLWDCGEFLTSAYKLEINHSPGAPLFMLLGRIFSLFSFDHPTQAAFIINMISAIASAATIMFLYWTTSWLISKIEEKSAVSWPFFVKTGAAAISALSFAFTDSFWFSAEEAEVYALSSLFSAVVLWVATRWERESDELSSSRWIILISFLIGLSIGVHLLNLLVIPSVALIIYFKKFTCSFKGLMVTIILSGLWIIALLHVFIPGILNLSKSLELFFVNTLNFPINSGLITYIALLTMLLSFGLFYTHRKQKKLLNLCLLCITFMLIGYTSYTATIIRATTGVPVNQGNPDSAFGLLNYLNREQYGSRPVLYGENIGSVVTGYKERNTWIARDNKYIKSKLNPEVEYNPATTEFFPRMHSNDPEHIDAYKNQFGFKGKKVRITDEEGNQTETIIPTFRENLTFFLNYQLGYMYLRYLMWNFAGRQNDIQGDGGLQNGNWRSGIPFIDRFVAGPQTNLPTETKENKGRNSYYFLPLLLGLAGLGFHYRFDKKNFLVTGLLFFLMSFALVVYLNEVPNTPRERDYVYVGSFDVFSIWIGFGVLAIFNLFQKFTDKQKAGICILTLGFLASPVLLLSQNYDDHNRSGRYSARDLARNYLESCEPDAILFTHGDNDTYPLWYCQEVEGIRRDVRVVVMPYLSAEWYISQIQRKVYDNAPLKMSIPLEKYQSESTDYVYVVPKIETEQRLTDVLGFVASDSSKTKLALENGTQISYIPVNKIKIENEKEDTIHVQLDKKALTKGDLAFWDIVATNAGKRPVCFTAWYDAEDHGLKNNLIFDGLVYRLTGKITNCSSILDSGKTDSKNLYDKLIKQCHWDNLKNKNVYFDWHHRRMFASMQIRQAFYRLAKQLTEEHHANKAIEVLNQAKEIMSLKNWPVDYQSILMAGLYTKNNQKPAGEAQFRQLAGSLEEWLQYYSSFSKNERSTVLDKAEYQLSLYNELLKQAADTLSSSELIKMKEKFVAFAANFE